jgi:hypothetical protein
MINTFDGLLSVGVLGFVAIVMYLWFKSQQVRWVERTGDDGDNEELQDKHQQQAQKLLEAEGYRVLGKNKRVRCDLLLHEKVWDGDLIADFTAMKDGNYFVCKVWTEKSELKPDCKDLRGELLPLQMLYRSSGCLFVDVVRDEIHVVSFGVYDRKGLILKWRNRLTWIAAGFLLALLVH